MNEEIRSLEPKPLWNYFSDLNAVPRPSKKEERVIAFMKSFGESLGLKTVVDDIGNVIIKKPASSGMEDRQTVVLQSHLDMVHQKNADTDFEFEKEGIKMMVEDDWVKAKGTTLGADNGIGVASIMALLASKDIQHPAIEALFTIDEETGMTGAQELKPGYLDGKLLLNLDTEDDRELTIGCAGGIDISASGTYQSVGLGSNYSYFSITVKGLTGGHSGMDIHLGRGNANKIMNRILMECSVKHDLKVCEIDGGGLRNAIPRESSAVIAIENSNLSAFEKELETLKKTIKNENKETDPSLDIVLNKSSKKHEALNEEFQFKILRSIGTCPNGIFRMSPNIPGLVQTSNNLARVLIKDNSYSILCLTRSALDSEKMELANNIKGAFELAGASVSLDGSYPGWAPNPNSKIVDVMADLYRKMHKEEPDVNACHAGLECGIIGSHYPEMDMVSFGPNIRGAHSPDEKVQISSVQKFWEYLLETLKLVPKE
ncbi:MAG: aminoacyl-histidine dipeptidase [Cytophagales bacterium]